MIIQLEQNISLPERANLIAQIKQLRHTVSEVTTQNGAYLICLGNPEVDIRLVGSLHGVRDVHVVSDNYKLVSAKWKTATSSIDLGDGVIIGNGPCTMMAGPCSIESEEQVAAVIQHLLRNNIRIMRGGVFKPRSSPYAFRGMGIDGLKMFYKQCKAAGIRIITEVMEIEQIDKMYDYIDIYQVGARNSQNFNLLDALGKVDKPVMLKRGISGTIDELLYSAEYIFSGGNEKLMLCERGIRTFENIYRNTFDINAIAILKEKTHLPVIADPSHGIGIRHHVPTIALAALIAGADGIVYEVHEQPEEALSDGQQTLNFNESEKLLNKINRIQAAALME
jgi:3-deoxy-7-phosphoheptulonate synthase